MSVNYCQDAIQFLSLKEVDGVYLPSENSNPLLWARINYKKKKRGLARSSMDVVQFPECSACVREEISSATRIKGVS